MKSIFSAMGAALLSFTLSGPVAAQGRISYTNESRAIIVITNTRSKNFLILEVSNIAMCERYKMISARMGEDPSNWFCLPKGKSA